MADQIAEGESAASVRAKLNAALAAIETLQSQVLPDPASLEDGTMVVVQNGSWVIVDRLEGGR